LRARPNRPFESAVRSLLTHRRLPLAILGLALLCSLPGLGVGYQADDWMHQATLRQVEPIEPQRAVLSELFTFMDGDPARNRLLRDQGLLPWWSPPHLLARFWRPVTAASHWLDHRLAPGNAVFAHAQSIAWGLLLVLLATALYRRVHGSAAVVAGLATLLYAVDEAHGWPIGWLANRNALTTGVLGFGVLLLHHRWRREGARWAGALAPVALGVGLLAGEAAIATTAYLFAYAVFLDGATRRSRLLSLLPYAAVVIAWRLAYSALGYGAAGSGLYLDPMQSPGLFLAALPVRLTTLLADQLLSFPSMIVAFLPRGLALAVSALLLAALLYLGRVCLGVVRASATARFWAIGMLLSILPVAATFPASRLLVFVGLGGAGLMAEVLVSLLPSLRSPGGETPSPGARRLGLGLAGLHLGVAALALPAQVLAPKVVGDLLFNECGSALSRSPDIAGKTAIYVNSNDLCVAYVSYARIVRGEPPPHDVRLLASGLYDLEVAGIDQHTVELRIPAGMQRIPADSLLRGRDDPLPVGARVELPGVVFEVMSHNADGLVDRVRARFQRRLRDPELVWLTTRGFTIGPFEPPNPGEVIGVPGVF